MIEAARRPRGIRLPLSVLFTLGFVASSWGGEPAEPKDHALFVGTTLQIECDGEYRELVGAEGRDVTVLAKGQTFTLPREKVNAVRVEPGLKLSSIVAEIDNLRTTAVDLPAGGDRFAADRMRILMDSMVGQSEERMDSDFRRVESATRAVSTATFGKADAQRVLDRARADYGRSVDTNLQLRGAVSSVTPSGAATTAIEVAFDLSCPRELARAFALLVTEIRTSSREKPEYRVHIEPLPKLGPKARRVTMIQGGLPPGFELGRVDVHLYANGQELATNLSAQRVDLTADDALRYLVLCYVASHPADTLAATPLKVALPSDFKQQAASLDLGRPVFVTVGPDGRVAGSSADSAGIAALDPYLDTVVRKFRFNPALAAGKPIESVVELTLAEFVR